MNGAVVLVQATASDLLTSDYQHKRSGGQDVESAGEYSVGPLRDAAIAPVVLTAPDIDENREVIPALAERWSVASFLGAEHDVTARMLAAADHHGADVIARVVMASFYVEPAIVRGQIALLRETRAGYCTVPRDFNINFAADVVRVDALRRFSERIAALPADVQSVARYRPWPFLEADAEAGATCVFTDVPEIAPERLDWIRAQLNWPERSGPGFDGGEYHALAADYVRPDDDLLDAGCGHGQITSILAQHARRATGVDYDAEMIELARQRFPGIEFEAADLQRWARPEAFDVIFHCHTLEHLPDPVATLRSLRSSLKPAGRLIVEVPLELRPGVINPHHEREYTVDGLLGELSRAGLRVVETRGVSRGIYVPAERRREAFVAVCTRDEEGSTDV